MTWPFWYNNFVKKYLVHSNAFQPSLQIPLSFSYEDSIDKDDISRTVKEVVEGANILKFIDFSNRNSYGYDGMKMLECVVLAFALDGYASTRKLEQYCKYDIRFQFIMDGQTPSHMAFHRFIHDDLMMPVEDIFYTLNEYIEQHDEINTDILYIDGTKFEANANKMTFVWMRATKKYREKRWKKIMERLVHFNVYCAKEGYLLRFSMLKELSFDYLFHIVGLIEGLMESKHIEYVHGRGHRKHRLQRFQEAFKEDAMKLWKYSIYYELAEGRNSFSKTDPDATFMHMKYDYYNNTNVFKPGYNVQVGSSDGYIRHVYISGDGADINTYIPFMKGYYKAYGEYPKKTPADAGYGSYDNYSFCKEHNIGLYMKYADYRKEKMKCTDKNRFRQYKMKRNEKGEIVCPKGHPFIFEKQRFETRGEYTKLIETYRNHHCEGCPLRKQCTKSKKGRTIQRNRQWERYKEEVRNNLATEEGKELMKQRSIQAEGIFGQIKQDNDYARLRRRGTAGVKLEILLVSIGHNIRRYHARKKEKQAADNKKQKLN